MLKVLDRLEEILIASLIAGATLLIFVAVTHRYALDMSAKFHLNAIYDALFKINLSWAQELCIYMFVWMAKFGAAYGVRFVWTLAHTDQTSPDLEMPMWIVYLAIPCGSYLMSFRFLQVTWTFIKTGELPHHDASHVEGVEGVEDAAAASPNLTPQPTGGAR